MGAIELDLSALQEIPEKLKNYCMMQVYEDARRHAPVVTSHLKDNIDINPADSTVSSNAKYSGYVEYGSEPSIRISKDGTYSLNKGIEVGTSKNPKTSWPAKTARGGDVDETMPFMRPAIYHLITKLENLPAAEWKKILK